MIIKGYYLAFHYSSSGTLKPLNNLIGEIMSIVNLMYKCGMSFFVLQIYPSKKLAIYAQNVQRLGNNTIGMDDSIENVPFRKAFMLILLQNFPNAALQS